MPNSYTASGHLYVHMLNNKIHKVDEILSNKNISHSHGSNFWEIVCNIRLNYYFCEYYGLVFEKWTFSGGVVY